MERAASLIETYGSNLVKRDLCALTWVEPLAKTKRGAAVGTSRVHENMKGSISRLRGVRYTASGRRIDKEALH